MIFLVNADQSWMDTEFLYVNIADMKAVKKYNTRIRQFDICEVRPDTAKQGTAENINARPMPFVLVHVKGLDEKEAYSYHQPVTQIKIEKDPEGKDMELPDTIHSHRYQFHADLMKEKIDENSRIYIDAKRFYELLIDKVV